MGSDPNSPYTRELTVGQIVELIQAMPVADAVSFVKAHVTPTNFPSVSWGQGWWWQAPALKQPSCQWPSPAACPAAPSFHRR